MKISYYITPKLIAACCLIFLFSAVSPPSASAVARSIRNDNNSCASIQEYAMGDSFISVGKSCNLQGQTYASSKRTSGDQSVCDTAAVQKFACIKRTLSSEIVNGKKTFGECIEQAQVCISKS